MHRGVGDWPVAEPVPVQDEFVTQVAEIELLGDNARIVLCTPRHIPGTDQYERDLVSKLVAPVRDALAMLDFCRAALQPQGNVVPFIPHH
ncbi:hypothetical protein FHS55_002080 [Angulomicrobium tetraedrale]|uniref:Uncharacterized protein n=1 Tax=Ancylobacter tetraedralis TaxID=217068 RepID=A0A839Z9R9_9HYPH|nr:hypothetical protein [Ancylobacter tetraedralis]MBB3771481.1 hypothetical protein [Ancylobacter tetraedralis]